MNPFGFSLFVKALMKLFGGGGDIFTFVIFPLNYLVGGFLPISLKHIGQNRSGSSSPIFGVNIKHV